MTQREADIQSQNTALDYENYGLILSKKILAEAITQV